MQLQNLFLYLHLLQCAIKSHRIIRFSCLFVYVSEKHINKCLIHIVNSFKSVEFVFIDFFLPCWDFSCLIVIILYLKERFSACANEQKRNIFKLELYIFQTQKWICMLFFILALKFMVGSLWSLYTTVVSSNPGNQIPLWFGI